MRSVLCVLAVPVFCTGFSTADRIYPFSVHGVVAVQVPVAVTRVLTTCKNEVT